MDSNNVSLSDIAALLQNNNSNNWGDNGLIWFFLIILVLGWGGFGGGRPQAADPTPSTVVVNPPQPPVQPPVTQGELNSAINNQTVQAALNEIAAGNQQTNYNIAELFSSQNMFMQQQQNTNNLTAIQGFNAITQQLFNQTNQLGSKLDNLSFQVDKCCCDMKSTMQQQEIDRLTRELNDANNKISNSEQTRTLLSNIGRFVAWEGTGTATSSAINS